MHSAWPKALFPNRTGDSISSTWPLGSEGLCQGGPSGCRSGHWRQMSCLCCGRPQSTVVWRARRSARLLSHWAHMLYLHLMCSGMDCSTWGSRGSKAPQQSSGVTLLSSIFLHGCCGSYSGLFFLVEVRAGEDNEKSMFNLVFRAK